jgi:hypothetical protein
MAGIPINFSVARDAVREVAPSVSTAIIGTL